MKIIVLFFLLNSLVFGQQSTQKKIQNNATKLQELKSSIKALEKKLKEQENKEKSELEVLANYEKQVRLLQTVLSTLEQEKNNKETAIKQTQKNLAKSEKELEERKEIFAKRLNRIQKTKRLSELELLLTSENFPEALRRLKFLFLLSNEDQKNIEKINQIKVKIIENKKVFEQELEEKKNILKQKETEEQTLSEKKIKQKVVLEKVQSDKNFVQKNIDDKKNAAKELEKIIAELEKIRLAELENEKREVEEQKRLAKAQNKKYTEVKTERQKFFIAAGSFSKNQGKLSWPVQGKIVNDFGLHKDPKLLTTTENTGIDIGTEIGSSVKAVANGKVIMITYLRGYGNTIILDHNDGFYTVYSHVTNITVQNNSYVKSGEIIGKVENTKNSQKGILHFEVWKNKDKQNPKNWLIK
ncbi:peptidoglycan DD-metalloendopeptidase family protein [bacterium]|nr:peptidoglycan DD-metalloendopeptidase family protein [bacterium]